jgi:hypothetical protein
MYFLFANMNQNRVFGVSQAILGVSNLSWDTDYRQGVFAGKPAYDHLADEPYGPARPAIPSQSQPKV